MSYKPKHTYVVTGLERCGTSMAMQCLHAGMSHIPGTWMKGFAIKEDINGYAPNPHGYYEMPPWSRQGPDWYKEVQGTLVKIMQWHIGRMGPAAIGYRYKVLWMTRDFEEMNASRVRSGKLPMDKFTVEAVTERDQGILGYRIDVDIVVKDHSEFMNDPVKVAHDLMRCGWEIINPSAFGAAVDRSLYRNRRVHD